MSISVSSAVIRWVKRKAYPAVKGWAGENLTLQEIKQTATKAIRAGQLKLYVPIHLQFTHDSPVRLDNPGKKKGGQSVRPISIVTINSGFCAENPIAPSLQSPNIVNAELRKELLACGDGDPGEILWMQAPTIFYPSAPKTFIPGKLKYWKDAFLNYYFSYHDSIQGVLKRGRMPIIIGGDHSIGFATNSTVNNFYFGETRKPIGLIWVDAHADINTRWTTPSGNFHGCPVSNLLGLSRIFDIPLDNFVKEYIRPDNLVYIATRDTDKGEDKVLEQLNIKVFRTADIERDGIKSIMEQARRIAGGGTSGISVSFDIDAVEGKYVPGTGTPVHLKDANTQMLRGVKVNERGLTREEAVEIGKIIHDWNNLVSFEMVEVNPEFDHKPDFPTVSLAAKILKNVIRGGD
jgi:arginase